MDVNQINMKGSVTGPQPYTRVQFRPSDPSLPIELFLSILEDISKEQGSSQIDQIDQAMSAIVASELDHMKLLTIPPQALNSWERFKGEMIKRFHVNKSLGDKVQLVKSAVRGEREDPRQFMVRARYIANLLGELSSDECARLIFLAGLPQNQADLCFAGNVDNWDILVDLLRQNDKFEFETSDNFKELDIPVNDMDCLVEDDVDLDKFESDKDETEIKNVNPKYVRVQLTRAPKGERFLSTQPTKRSHSIDSKNVVVPKLLKLAPSPKKPTSQGIPNEDSENISPLFNCNLCDYETDLAAWLEKHKRQNHKEVKKRPTTAAIFECPEPYCHYKLKPNEAGGRKKRLLYIKRHLSKVWSLTPFYSVDFSKSRIGVKSAFATNAQSRISSAFLTVSWDLRA